MTDPTKPRLVLFSRKERSLTQAPSVAVLNMRRHQTYLELHPVAVGGESELHELRNTILDCNCLVPKTLDRGAVIWENRFGPLGEWAVGTVRADVVESGIRICKCSIGVTPVSCVSKESRS